MDDFSDLETLNHQLSSLFLGDLSIYSTERDIRHLFRNYGIIDQVRIKRGGSGKPHLSYGFIKFRDRESAELAMRDLNGTVFLGRALRIGWAEPKSNTKVIKPRKESNHTSTAQIHVSFISKQVDALITEATLRGLFSMYGEVVDVAIKKTQFDRKLQIQNGYGFVHYALTPAGVQSAITATKAIHQVTIDRVTYDCSLSHALEVMVGPEVAAEIYAPKNKNSLTVDTAALARSMESMNVSGNNNNHHQQMDQSSYTSLNSPTRTTAAAVSPVGPGGAVSFGAQANNLPKPPPIAIGNQQLPPLPPHHYYASGSPHNAMTGNNNQSPRAGLNFPHQELEKRGLLAYSPTSTSSTTLATGSGGSGISPPSGSTSLLQSSHSSTSPNHQYAELSTEFYGIAELKKATRPPLPVTSEAHYYNNNGDPIAYQTTGPHHHRSYSNTSSNNSQASYNLSYNSSTDGLALSDSSSEMPFERLSLSESRTSKPSPTNSLRSNGGNLSSLSMGSLDRSPMYAHHNQQQPQYQHKQHPAQSLYAAGMTPTPSVSGIYPVGSSSLDSSLSISTLSSALSQHPQYTQQAPLPQQMSSYQQQFQQQSARYDTSTASPYSPGRANVNQIPAGYYQTASPSQNNNYSHHASWNN